MTTPVAGVGGSDLSSTTASNTVTGQSLDKDSFLKLLVAQMRYQSPDQPVDSSQFMAQMAQFTQVEKLSNLEEAMAQATAWQRTVAGEGMVGRTVTATGAGGAAVTDVVTGLVLGDSGPQLTLAKGGTVGLDDVIAVAQTDPPSG